MPNARCGPRVLRDGRAQADREVERCAIAFDSRSLSFDLSFSPRLLRLGLDRFRSPTRQQGARTAAGPAAAATSWDAPEPQAPRLLWQRALTRLVCTLIGGICVNSVGIVDVGRGGRVPGHPPAPLGEPRGFVNSTGFGCVKSGVTRCARAVRA